ncbi:hypothetical protein ACWD48_19845 [Streptomyces sp. NPDC002519]
MALVHEFPPVRPRKASASRRRRHLTQLPYRLHQIVPGAATILLNPVWSDAKGPTERTFVALCRDADGQQLQLPRGASRTIAALIQGAYPTANWDHTQTWRADTNQLTTWRQRQAAS